MNVIILLDNHLTKLYNYLGDKMIKKIQVDYLYEAFALIDKLMPGKDQDEELYNNYSSFNIKNNSLGSLFTNYFTFKKAIIEQVGTINPEINPYFDVFIYQTPFIINFYRYKQTHFDDDLKKCINGFFIDTLQELTNQAIDALDLAKFITLINSLELKDNEKLMVIDFFMNGEAIYHLVMKEATRVEKIIKVNYHLIKNDIDNFHQQIDNINLIASLNELLQFDYFKSDDFLINISIFYYNQLLLNKEEDNLHIYLGYLIFILKDLKELNTLEDKRILSILKVISEPTRYKIIKLLKTKEMYVQEIANELGLTSATLVHHLEILLNERLIEFVENNYDKKKIFYKVNSNSINQFIKILGETLK